MKAHSRSWTHFDKARTIRETSNQRIWQELDNEMQGELRKASGCSSICIKANTQSDDRELA